MIILWHVIDYIGGGSSMSFSKKPIINYRDEKKQLDDFPQYWPKSYISCLLLYGETM